MFILSISSKDTQTSSKSFLTVHIYIYVFLSSDSWKDIVRALILSNFGKTLVILVVLCGTQNSDTFIQLIKAYICAANVQALRGMGAELNQKVTCKI